MGPLTKRVAAALGIALVACFGVFLLPFLLPPAPIAAVSAANCGGFNNRVAVLAAALISMAMLGLAVRLDWKMPAPQPQDCARMSRRRVLLYVAVFASLASVLDIAIYASGLRYLSDFGYFLEQMSKAADYHRHLYAQLEFPYGPLLFYPPIWLSGLLVHFARPLAIAHVFLLLLHQVGGVLLLAYVMQRLPIKSSLRRWMFPLLMLFGISLNAAPNYALLRFVAPLACLLCCVHQRRPRSALLFSFIAEVAMLATSPEMGFAFAAGVAAYSLLTAWTEKSLRWVAVALSPVLGSAAFLIVVGPDYLSMLRAFSGGALNLSVEPQPYTLLYLAGVVALAPLTVVSFWRQRRPEWILLAAFYVVGLALLPVALGRSDAGHIVLNGLSIFLLMLVAASGWLANRLRGFSVLLVLTLLFSLGVAINVFLAPLRLVAGVDVIRYGPASMRDYFLRGQGSAQQQFAARIEKDPSAVYPSFDIQALRSLTAGAAVITPAKVTPSIEAALKKNAMYIPDYYAYLTAIINTESEQREIAQVNSQQWMLLPDGGFSFLVKTPETARWIAGLPFPYHQRRAPFVAGQLLQQNLEKNWMSIKKIDGYTLYRRNW